MDNKSSEASLYNAKSKTVIGPPKPRDKVITEDGRVFYPCQYCSRAFMDGFRRTLHATTCPSKNYILSVGNKNQSPSFVVGNNLETAKSERKVNTVSADLDRKSIDECAFLSSVKHKNLDKKNMYAKTENTRQSSIKILDPKMVLNTSSAHQIGCCSNSDNLVNVIQNNATKLHTNMKKGKSANVKKKMNSVERKPKMTKENPARKNIKKGILPKVTFKVKETKVKKPKHKRVKIPKKSQAINNTPEILHQDAALEIAITDRANVPVFGVNSKANISKNTKESVTSSNLVPKHKMMKLKNINKQPKKNTKQSRSASTKQAIKKDPITKNNSTKSKQPTNNNRIRKTKSNGAKNHVNLSNIPENGSDNIAKSSKQINGTLTQEQLLEVINLIPVNKNTPNKDNMENIKDIKTQNKQSVNRKPAIQKKTQEKSSNNLKNLEKQKVKPPLKMVIKNSVVISSSQENTPVKSDDNTELKEKPKQRKRKAAIDHSVKAKKVKTANWQASSVKEQLVKQKVAKKATPPKNKSKPKVPKLKIKLPNYRKPKTVVSEIVKTVQMENVPNILESVDDVFTEELDVLKEIQPSQPEATANRSNKIQKKKIVNKEKKTKAKNHSKSEETQKLTKINRKNTGSEQNKKEKLAINEGVKKMNASQEQQDQIISKTCCNDSIKSVVPESETIVNVAKQESVFSEAIYAYTNGKMSGDSAENAISASPANSEKVETSPRKQIQTSIKMYLKPTSEFKLNTLHNTQTLINELNRDEENFKLNTSLQKNTEKTPVNEIKPNMNSKSDTSTLTGYSRIPLKTNNLLSWDSDSVSINGQVGAQKGHCPDTPNGMPTVEEVPQLFDRHYIFNQPDDKFEEDEEEYDEEMDALVLEDTDEPKEKETKESPIIEPISENLQKRTCKFCHMVFPKAMELLRHRRSVHKFPKILMSMSELEKYYKTEDKSKCPLCSKPIKNGNKSYFNKHLKTHSDIMNYTCSKCHKKFRRVDHMKDHEKRHVIS